MAGSRNEATITRSAQSKRRSRSARACLVGRDDRAGLLDVEVQHRVRELLEHLLQQGEAEPVVRGRPSAVGVGGLVEAGADVGAGCPPVGVVEAATAPRRSNEAIAPVAAVVRSTVASWQTTRRWSAVACTSSSMPVAPASRAPAMACSVDDGASQAPPWWA